MEKLEVEVEKVLANKIKGRVVATGQMPNQSVIVMLEDVSTDQTKETKLAVHFIYWTRLMMDYKQAGQTSHTVFDAVFIGSNKQIVKLSLTAAKNVKIQFNSEESIVFCQVEGHYFGRSKLTISSQAEQQCSRLLI